MFGLCTENGDWNANIMNMEIILCIVFLKFSYI